MLMNADCKLLNSYKPVSWFLIVTILLITLLPAHYHLHHHYKDALHSAATKHEHVIDLHVLTEITGQSHHNDEVTIIAASPDGIMKKSTPDFSPFILLAMVLVLLPVLNKRINIQISYRSTNIKQSFPHFTPQLRAPPLH